MERVSPCPAAVEQATRIRNAARMYVFIFYFQFINRFFCSIADMPVLFQFRQKAIPMAKQTIPVSDAKKQLVLYFALGSFPPMYYSSFNFSLCTFTSSPKSIVHSPSTSVSALGALGGHLGTPTNSGEHLEHLGTPTNSTGEHLGTPTNSTGEHLGTPTNRELSCPV